MGFTRLPMSHVARSPGCDGVRSDIGWSIPVVPGDPDGFRAVDAWTSPCWGTRMSLPHTIDDGPHLERDIRRDAR